MSFGLTAGAAFRFLVVRADTRKPSAGATINSVRLQLRTGDKAILIGVAAIAAYEAKVRDDDDLISRRVAAWRRTPLGRVLVDTTLLVTYLHLTEYAKPEYDLFHHLMGVVRPKNVGGQE